MKRIFKKATAVFLAVLISVGSTLLPGVSGLVSLTAHATSQAGM